MIARRIDDGFEDALTGSRPINIPSGLAMPSSINIRIGSNLSGIGVQISGGPSSRDPLGQGNGELFYENLEDALAHLRDDIVVALQHHVQL